MAAYIDYQNWRKGTLPSFPQSVWVLLESVRSNFAYKVFSELDAKARDEAINRTLLFFEQKFLLPSTLDYLDTKAAGEDSFRNTIYFLLSQFYNELGMQRNPKYAAFSDLLKSVLHSYPEIFILSQITYIGKSSIALSGEILSKALVAEDLLHQNPMFKQKAKNEHAKQLALRAIQILSEENKLLFNQLLPRIAAAFGVAADVFTIDLDHNEGVQDQDDSIPSWETVSELADSSTDPSLSAELFDGNSFALHLLAILEKQAGVKKVQIYLAYFARALAAEEKKDENFLEKSKSSSSDSAEPIIQVLCDRFAVKKSTIYAAIKDCDKILRAYFAKYDFEENEQIQIVRFLARQSPARS